jgi:hypothetical protein
MITRTGLTTRDNGDNGAATPAATTGFVGPRPLQ